MLLEELFSTCDQLFREGRFTAAVTACDKALASAMASSDRCRALQLKARALVAQDGRWGGPAISCLKEALQLTKPGTDEHGRVLCAFTAAYAGLCCVMSCRQYRDEFVKLLRAKKTETLVKLYPHVEYNLALAYHQIEDLDLAEGAYLLALKSYQDLKDPAMGQLIADVKNNLIDVFQELGRHEEAHGLLDQIASVFPEEQFGAQIRMRRAIYAMHRDDLIAALLWAESGLGHPSCDVRTRGALMLTKAKIAQASGQPVEAHDCALEAMRLAALGHSSHLCHRVSQFLKTVSRGDSR